MKAIGTFLGNAIGGFIGIYIVKVFIFSHTITWDTQDILYFIVAPIIYAAYVTYKGIVNDKEEQ